MFYLSDIVGKKIRDSQGNSLARIQDLVAELPESELDEEQPDDRPEGQASGAQDENDRQRVPVVKALVARTSRRGPDIYLPIGQLVLVAAEGATLTSPKVDLTPFEQRESEILLRRDLWDKQVIDLDTRKVVRVNDVLISDRAAIDGRRDAAGKTWEIPAVDVGISGLLRRLHLGGLTRNIANRPGVPRIVQWKHLDVFGSLVPGGVPMSHKKLAALHPVDIARITDSVSYRQGAEIISSLEDTLAADALEEIDESRQTDIMEQIPDERAAHIIEEMSPEDATDLLADMPEEKVDALLDQMDQEEAEELRQLMRYPERSAGGIMTTDFVRALPTMTVAEVIEANKEVFGSADFVYYIFVLDPEEENKLAGIITVRDLLYYENDSLVGDIMIKDFLSVRPGERDEEVARKMAEYNLMALPVIDATGELHGVVTVDDALDAVLPEGWKKRMPRLFR